MITTIVTTTGRDTALIDFAGHMYIGTLGNMLVGLVVDGNSCESTALAPRTMKMIDKNIKPSTKLAQVILNNMN